MKVYYVANARMPTERAHGIQIAKMCEAFAEAGVLVELIVPRRKTIPDSLRDFYGLRVSVPIVRLPVFDWYAANRLGFAIGSASFMVSYFFYLLFQRIRGHGGIVYTIDIDQFSFALVPFLGMPYFAEIHDAKKKSASFSLLFRHAQGVVVINNRIKETLVREFGISPERIIVCPNGVDIEKFGALFPDARKTLGLAEEKPIAMYVGKLYGWKGIQVLVDAANEAKDILFVVVGGTEEELKTVTGTEYVPENIFFAGQRRYDELPVWLNAADVLMVLGTKANEYSYLHTSPMKLFEYMPAGKPVVVAKTPANEQIVEEADVIFYAPDDAKDLASKIRYALDAPPEVIRSKKDRMKKKAHLFAWKKRAETISAFLEKSK